jgi:hypothetical protein
VKATATVWPAAIASGALIAQQVAGKATRDTLFLSHFGLQLLPAAMIGAALVSSVSVVTISRTLKRYGPARVVRAMFGASAVLFLLELWLSQYDLKLAAAAVYLHTALFGSASVSAFWSFVNESFDPHTAKKLVGRIASGGTVGGVVGGLLVWRASAHLSVAMMLALLGAMNVVGLWAALRMASREGRGSSSTESFSGGGVQALRETPYLVHLALLVCAGAFIQALLDWLFSAHATARFGKGQELLAFFALYNMIVGIASFASQTALTRFVLEKLGLARTVRIMPVGVTLAAAAALVSPGFSPVAFLRWLEAVVRNSMYRSAYELFYTPLPNAKKRAAKTLVDVGFDRIGTMVGSAGLLVVARLDQTLADRIVLFGTIGMSVLMYLLTARLHDGYVGTLAENLKSRAITLDDDDAYDFTTKKTLAETTALLDREKLLARIEQFQKAKESRADGTDPGLKGGAVTKPSASTPRDVASAEAPPDLTAISDPLVQRAAALRSGDTATIRKELATALPTTLAPFAVPLLANDAVVRDAVRALRKIAPKVTGQLLDALLDTDADPRVRRRIPRVMKVVRTQRAAAGLLMALRDPVFEVRVQVALALAQMLEEAPLVVERDAVFEIVLHELTNGRASWSPHAPGAESADADADEASTDESGDDVHRGLAHVFTVLGLVLDRQPLAIAHRALRAEDPGLRGTAFEYLEVVLPPRLREVIVPLVGVVKPAPRSRERGSKELAEELLRSQAASPRPKR